MGKPLLGPISRKPRYIHFIAKDSGKTTSFLYVKLITSYIIHLYDAVTVIIYFVLRNIFYLPLRKAIQFQTVQHLLVFQISETAVKSESVEDTEEEKNRSHLKSLWPQPQLMLFTDDSLFQLDDFLSILLTPMAQFGICPLHLSLCVSLCDHQFISFQFGLGTNVSTHIVISAACLFFKLFICMCF